MLLSRDPVDHYNRSTRKIARKIDRKRVQGAFLIDDDAVFMLKGDWAPCLHHMLLSGTSQQ